MIRQGIILISIILSILGGIKYGYAQAQQQAELAAREAETAYRRLEHTKQIEMEKQYAQATKDRDQARVERDAALQQSVRLRDQIHAGGRYAAQIASASHRNMASAQAPWLVLQACRREYETLAADADALTTDFRIMQGWGNVIRHSWD